MKTVNNSNWFMRKISAPIENQYWFVLDIKNTTMIERLDGTYGEEFQELVEYELDLSKGELFNLDGILYKVVYFDIMPYFEPI